MKFCHLKFNKDFTLNFLSQKQTKRESSKVMENAVKQVLEGQSERETAKNFKIPHKHLIKLFPKTIFYLDFKKQAYHLLMMKYLVTVTSSHRK